MREISLKANLEKLTDVLAFVDSELEKAGASMKAQIQIDVAVEEMFVNIAHYAYTHSSEKGDAVISVEILEDPRRIKIGMKDWGEPFNPLEKDDPDTTLPLEQRKIGGLGIFMAKKNMDKVLYEYKDKQNILTMIKAI